MYGRVRQVSPEQLSQFQRSPESLDQFLFAQVEASAPKIKAALARVQELATSAGSRGNLTDAETETVRASILRELMNAGVGLPGTSSEEGLSLEKSWHALHYLLTGRVEVGPPPLGNAIMGGEEIGEERDYGRVRFLTPKQVQEISAALASISKQDLVDRFDAGSMKASKVIYPCKDRAELDIALHYFEQLVEYYSEAAARGNAMLLYIE